MGLQVLEEEGYQVCLASDGDEALERAVRQRPDLAIVGTRMGGVSGVDLCRLMKTDPELGVIRLILLAGPRETLPDERSPAPFDGMLRKPLDPDSVLRAVRGLLDEGKAQADPLFDPASTPENRTSAAGPATGPLASAAAPRAEGAEGKDAPTSKDDPFADVVRTALARIPPVDAAEVRLAVTSAVEAAVPGIVNRVTEQIVAIMRKP